VIKIVKILKPRSFEIARPHFKNFGATVWKVLHITVDDEERSKLLKLIEKEKSLFIPFRSFETFEYPELGTTKKNRTMKKNIRYPILSSSTFLSNAPIVVIDTSKQNDSATATSVNVQLEIETSESLTGVTAYCLLIHDCIVEYVPFTREEKEENEK
ncbi:Uncharacterized protein FWK35_00028711, partial [Aphis craccivora]